MATVKELLEDHHIQPDMMKSELSAVTSLFTPSKLTPLTDNGDPIVTNKVPVGSTLNNIVTPDLNRELNTYKDRLTLELNNFKEQLEIQSRIEVECAKKNLKSEFDLELCHQTLTQTETINALRQQNDQVGAHLQQQQVTNCPVLPTAPQFEDVTLPPPDLVGLVEVMDILNRSMTNQYAILQETLRQTQSTSKEHYLSNA